jgi:hypothetical protein
MDDASAGTWESGSEISASVVSGSSVWTEGSNPTDRSSRRKLILQMAKARMKSNKDGLSPTSGACSADVKAHAIPEEGGFSDGQSHGDARKMMEAKRKPSIGGGSSVDANPADIDFSGD